MFFYVDESGQTGLNLFDESQPYLYYGVLSSRTNLDVLAKKKVIELRKKLKVDRLHASELGVGPIVDITPNIIDLIKEYNLKFDFCKVAKVDYAVISFFDQIFDSVMNPAVPWTTYWTPLRYSMLVRVASLFDLDLIKSAWKARVTTNSKKSEEILVDVCKVLIDRIYLLPDKRSQEIVKESLEWVIKNPSEIQYNTDSKKMTLQISPNLIGFQAVMHGIAIRLKKTNRKPLKIIVDRQSQFNRAQEVIADYYRKGRGVAFVNGPGLPEMDLKHMPNIPISCTPGDESVGLELVDIFIWVFKRRIEKKDLPLELKMIIIKLTKHGFYNEISMKAIKDRWGKWFENLPIPTEEQKNKAKEMIRISEENRKAKLG